MLISNPRIPYSLVTINHCQILSNTPVPNASKLLYLPILARLIKSTPPPLILLINTAKPFLCHT